MSEEEQAINVSEWKELHSEIEEVREKRDRLQAENNRLKTLMQLTRKECEWAKNELQDMTARRDHAKAQWEECCEDRSRQVAALREQLAEMTTSRDNFERLCKEWRIEFDAISAKKDDLQVELSQWQVGHDVMKEQLQQMVAERDAARKFADDTQVELRRCRVEHNAAADMFEAENTYLKDTIQKLRAKQIHDDLPGLLKAIQAAAEQARDLI
jgi:chromosome segregation ATPase